MNKCYALKKCLVWMRLLNVTEVFALMWNNNCGILKFNIPFLLGNESAK